MAATSLVSNRGEETAISKCTEQEIIERCSMDETRCFDFTNHALCPGALATAAAISAHGEKSAFVKNGLAGIGDPAGDGYRA